MVKKDIRENKNIPGKVKLTDKIVKAVLNTIEEYNMLNKKDIVLISISGGPDSTFLTYVMNSIKNNLDLRLYAFHLDHMTRKGQSTKDSIFVEKLCNELGISLVRKKIDVKKWCCKEKLSFQEGARILRQRFLNEIAEKYSINKIALGHNADDNIETFFMHFLRGAGLKGLSGIKPVDINGKFIRPLIETFKKDILKYLNDKNITYCIDTTNMQNLYSRNKIRNILLPLIREKFSVSIDFNILRLVNILREENEFISSFSSEIFNRIAVIEKNIACDSKSNEKTEQPYLVILQVTELIKLAVAVRKRIIIESIEKIKGCFEDIKKINIDSILKYCKLGGERKEIELAGRIGFVKEADNFYFFNINKINKLLTKDGISKEQFIKKHSYLPIEKILRNQNKKSFQNIIKFLDADNLLLKTNPVFTGVSDKIIKKFGIRIESEIIKGNLNDLDFKSMSLMDAYLDFDKIKFPVKVKSWDKDKGEYFYPFGLNKEKKIHDFFIDNKIPLSLRKTIPIFADRKKIIWVGKYRIDERVKIDSSTKKVLHIKIIDI
ncbi:MAG: tRNA lysidine(34) synthetase TilS [Actinobacteria bacterium]|nr:tRNA lysidine(34) synthetase TilS [Actinomycetota bacterium]